MSKSTQPARLPTANSLVSRNPREPSKTSPVPTSFYLAAANTGWQLAVVVLLPIFIGYKLDEHHSGAWFLALGFIIAILGAGTVIWRQFKLFTPKITPQEPKK